MSTPAISPVRSETSPQGGLESVDASVPAPRPHRPWFRQLRELSRSLVARFLILSLLSMTAVSLVSASLLSRFLTDRMLALDVQLTTEFVNHIFGVEGADRSFSQASPQSQTRELARFFEHMGRMPDILRSNIYQLDGTVLWSTDHSIVGRRFADNDELAEAAVGKPLFALGVTGAADKDEHIDLGAPGRAFVENYIPMYRGGRIGDEVVGVAEVYRTPAALLAAVQDGRRWVFIVAGIGTFLMIATQCWLVGRADRVIRRQAAAIATNERLATAGEMAAAVAHGLRNPLASIRSSAELALRLRSVERVQTLLGDIIAQSDRLEHWVRQYLGAVEPDAAERASDLEPVLTAVRTNFATEVERLNVAWRESSEPGLPKVRIAPALLEQVLNGLVANAVQAMPEGGEIELSARRVDPRTVEIAVADKGVGMTAEQLRRAFVPFATTKSTGLGLGLPLARRILERHGGSLELTSAPGKGTVAALRLPAVG